MADAISSSSKVIRCKAVVCWGIGEAMKVEEIQVEAPKSGEARVKMLYASLCHTDILVSKGFPFPHIFPRVLGHEGVGVVESIGEEVRDIKVGDVVIPTFVAECGECENCVSGKTNMCLKYPLDFSGLMQDGTSRLSVKGQRLYHVFSCSTWSEYMVANVNYLVKLPDADADSYSLPHASIFSCGFSTGFGAPWKEAKIEKGSTVAVIGLGAVGLGAIEGARMQGASRIIGVDKNEPRREKGKAFGMTDFINPHDQPHNNNKSVSELIKELTAGIGVDYCFECSGFPPFINEALEAVKLGKGTAILIGASKVTSAQINSLSLLCGRTLKGSMFGGIKTKTDLPIIIQKWMNKEMQLDQLLTHEVPLVDINRALELSKQPDCVRVLIKI